MLHNTRVQVIRVTVTYLCGVCYHIHTCLHVWVMYLCLYVHYTYTYTIFIHYTLTMHTHIRTLYKHCTCVCSLAVMGTTVFSLARDGAIRGWPAVQPPPPQHVQAWRVRCVCRFGSGCFPLFHDLEDGHYMCAGVGLLHPCLACLDRAGNHSCVLHTSA